VIRVEFVRQVRRLRTWIALGALGGLPTIVAIANHADRNHVHRGVQAGVFQLASYSGLNHALAALTFMSPFFLVVVVGNFAGESVAGEASWGTLRALLTRPVSRPKLLASKLFVACVLTLAATAAITVTAVIVGSIVFGWHGVLTPFGAPLSVGEGSARLALASVYVAMNMLGVVTFGLMLSTFTDQSAGAIGGAIALAIASQILEGVPSLRALHPWMPTRYWSAWSGLFSPQPVRNEMLHGVVLQLGYAAVFTAIAFRHFARKDILS